MHLGKRVLAGVGLGILALATVFCFSRYLNYKERKSFAEGFTRGRVTSPIVSEMSQAKVPPYEIPREAAIVDDLRLLLALDKERYLKGEDVIATALLVNASPDPLIISGRIWAAQADLKLEVVRDDGSSMSYLGGGRLDFGGMHPCEVLELRPRVLHGIVISISSGTHAFDLSQPGHYELRAIYSVSPTAAANYCDVFKKFCDPALTEHAWTGSISATPVNFTIDGQ